MPNQFTAAIYSDDATLAAIARPRNRCKTASASQRSRRGRLPSGLGHRLSVSRRRSRLSRRAIGPTCGRPDSRMNCTAKCTDFSYPRPRGTAIMPARCAHRSGPAHDDGSSQPDDLVQQGRPIRQTAGAECRSPSAGGGCGKSSKVHRPPLFGADKSSRCCPGIQLLGMPSHQRLFKNDGHADHGMDHQAKDSRCADATCGARLECRRDVRSRRIQRPLLFHSAVRTPCGHDPGPLSRGNEKRETEN
jgi:hypothetical protein